MHAITVAVEIRQLGQACSLLPPCESGDTRVKSQSRLASPAGKLVLKWGWSTVNQSLWPDKLSDLMRPTCTIEG